MTKFVALLDRGVLKVSGPDASEFLQGLITNDMDKLAEKDALFAALLTPQGKINYEFFVVPIEGGFLLDMAKGGLREILGKLSLYKMRADVAIGDLSETHMVFWLENKCEGAGPALARFNDPRSDALGCRAVVAVEDVAAFSDGLEAGLEEEYMRARIENGVPEGGHDYVLGDTFPHEACYDLLDGVDFKKGCYVGQEVVSRMQHRGTTRKRIVCVSGEGELPDSGAEIRTEKSLIGVLGSRVAGHGLALVRLDRAGKAIAAQEPMSAEAVEVTLSLPEWADYELKSAVAAEED